jgi:hypothetical protein
MNVFNTETATNLLPSDGLANYYGKVLKQQESQYRVSDSCMLF